MENGFVGLFFIFGFLWLVFRKKEGQKPESFRLEPSQSSLLGNDHICTSCGSSDQKLKSLKGSTSIEVLLWLLILSWPLALVYSLWRRSGKGNVCAACGGNLIPTDTPMGRDLAKKYKA